MTNNKMLIDATHEEETRVVIIKENKIEEFDFEAASRRQLKGNIYLAKITRVEPSLQAAFVDFGGNRHGFLAFNEIHLDYYQISVANKIALLKEQDKIISEISKENEIKDTNKKNNYKNINFTRLSSLGIFTYLLPIKFTFLKNKNLNKNTIKKNTSILRGIFTSLPSIVFNKYTNFKKKKDFENKKKLIKPKITVKTTKIKNDTKHTEFKNESDTISTSNQTSSNKYNSSNINYITDNINTSKDFLISNKIKLNKLYKLYEIQQVIKKHQIILVQVVKEERGNKGAALTTFLSLAGRYCVLMPNTPKGGGISRKITNLSDRKRLKEIVKNLVINKGMGLIVRTAGANRTSIDIERDYEYLIRLWKNVCNLTVQSISPYLVYEEGNLIKRSIRDLFNKNIDSVIVSGENGYKDAKTFIQMLMPSHAKKVYKYKENQPIFIKYHVEQQLDSIYNPDVKLKSGGYLVINQTEALVSIDINSGKSTKENTIENTALNTNLEAAEEIARQLKLRDLAGLIVIDFIDMEENKNNRAVEKKIKECLILDRAKIQVGKISNFGLLEMSRQRLRSSLLEGSTDMCPHCHGTGLIRSNSSMALHILNILEYQLIQGQEKILNIFAPLNITMFLLNNKRHQLFKIEEKYNAKINIEVDSHLEGVNYRIETSDFKIQKNKLSTIRLESEFKKNNNSYYENNEENKKDYKTKKNHLKRKNYKIKKPTEIKRNNFSNKLFNEKTSIKSTKIKKNQFNTNQIEIKEVKSSEKNKIKKPTEIKININTDDIKNKINIKSNKPTRQGWWSKRFSRK